MGKRGFLRSLLLASCLGVFGAGANAAPFTINDALRMAVQTNPSVGEAAANKRATEAELRQVQSTLLPQVRLEASAGPERLNNPATFPLSNVVPTLNNGQYVAGAQGSIFIRQLLFDGFTSLHEIWRNAARVDAAAARTHERSELIALDASGSLHRRRPLHPASSRWRRRTSPRTSGFLETSTSASAAAALARAISNRHVNASTLPKSR
jgi:hypothetical protein